MGVWDQDFPDDELFTDNLRTGNVNFDEIMRPDIECLAWKKFRSVQKVVNQITSNHDGFNHESTNEIKLESRDENGAKNILESEKDHSEGIEVSEKSMDDFLYRSKDFNIDEGNEESKNESSFSVNKMEGSGSQEEGSQDDQTPEGNAPDEIREASQSGSESQAINKPPQPDVASPSQSQEQTEDVGADDENEVKHPSQLMAALRQKLPGLANEKRVLRENKPPSKLFGDLKKQLSGLGVNMSGVQGEVAPERARTSFEKKPIDIQRRQSGQKMSSLKDKLSGLGINMDSVHSSHDRGHEMEKKAEVQLAEDKSKNDETNAEDYVKAENGSSTEEAAGSGSSREQANRESENAVGTSIDGKKQDFPNPAPNDFLASLKAKLSARARAADSQSEDVSKEDGDNEASADLPKPSTDLRMANETNDDSRENIGEQETEKLGNTTEDDEPTGAAEMTEEREDEEKEDAASAISNQQAGEASISGEAVSKDSPFENLEQGAEEGSKADTDGAEAASGHASPASSSPQPEPNEDKTLDADSTVMAEANRPEESESHDGVPVPSNAQPVKADLSPAANDTTEAAAETTANTPPESPKETTTKTSPGTTPTVAIASNFSPNKGNKSSASLSSSISSISPADIAEVAEERPKGNLFKMWESTNGLAGANRHKQNKSPKPHTANKLSHSFQVLPGPEASQTALLMSSLSRSQLVGPSSMADSAPIKFDVTTPKTVEKTTSDAVVSEQEARIDEETTQLLKDIRRIGKEGDPHVTFGELFEDPQVEQYYEALVGTLKTAKKRGLISFKGQMLLKGVNDGVRITIVGG